MYHPNHEIKNKVYKTFGRNEKMVQDDVHAIKTWLTSQKHLPEKMEDDKIRNFLALNKFSIEKTKQKIDMYYTVRSTIPEFFEKKYLKLESLKYFFDNRYLCLFPQKLDGVHTVWYFKMKAPNTFDPNEFCNIFLAIYEVRLYEDFLVSDMIIVDGSTMSLNDIKKISPTLLAKFVAVYQKVFSLRLHGLILINCPSYITVLVSMLKLVLKPKLFARTQVHSDCAVLKQLLPNDFIVKDYGGDGPSLKELNETMLEKLSGYLERFDQLDRLKVDESLRPTKVNNDDVLGYYGNFKKIDVD